eukprot:2630637-Amphidinium_carterae.1
MNREGNMNIHENNIIVLQYTLALAPWSVNTRQAWGGKVSKVPKLPQKPKRRLDVARRYLPDVILGTLPP